MSSDTRIQPDEARTRDGRRLYVERAGSGSPVVVFESGMGGSRSSWGAVLPEVARHTEAVVYDRSGLGRSPRDDQPRVLARLVSDHVDLLDHLGAGPFVLVGHSWGGPIVRSVAGQVPERIAGLVLVDQSDEGADLFFSKAGQRQTRLMKPLAPVLARLGILRYAVGKLAAQLPEPAASSMRAEDTTVDSARAFGEELASSVDDLQRLRNEPPFTPDVPVTIISGLRQSRMERGARHQLIAAHRARAAALPQGRHVEAALSGHYVPITEPQLVVDEVLRIVELADSART